jgi:hypothetical protein
MRLDQESGEGLDTTSQNNSTKTTNCPYDQPHVSCVCDTAASTRLGKTAAAALIQGKLPTTKQIRFGDLGEIYATEWIDAHSGSYRAPIKRLRWKDHRNMAMRGDDVIAML